MATTAARPKRESTTERPASGRRATRRRHRFGKGVLARRGCTPLVRPSSIPLREGRGHGRQHDTERNQGGTMRPTLVTNPVTDRVFAAFAEQQLEDGLELAVFGARLRVRYPQAVVHSRD